MRAPFTNTLQSPWCLARRKEMVFMDELWTTTRAFLEALFSARPTGEVTACRRLEGPQSSHISLE